MNFYAAESMSLSFQDLLQMQYEGRVIMDIFGKATVNVNLMLFLLNKKFYGKSWNVNSFYNFNMEIMLFLVT